jgi:DNA-binding MarR family transcriptional regulator
MTPQHKAVLAYLAENSGTDWDGCYRPFAPIMEETGLDRATVRRACRALARKGLAEYSNALSDMDGRFRGAGYAATKAGKSLAQERGHD